MRREPYQRVDPHGELVEPWAASFFSSLLEIVVPCALRREMPLR
jgi:hypothetical protein